MIKLIESKLRPPDLSPTLIKREHLADRLCANLSLNATFICAGPGWGKTTIAAEFLQTIDRAAIWYDVNPSDADSAVFFQYLVHAVRNVEPGFGARTLDCLESGAPARLDQLADLFLYELTEGIDRQLVLVLDNMHHVFAADWTAKVLYRIIQLLPENVHLMLLARTAPPFTFSRMRSKQSLDHLDDTALAFTRAETDQLFRGVCDDAKTIEKLLGWTEGWIAGLQIIRHALEADERFREQDIEKIINKSQTEIFDYFAERVYRAEPEEMRALLVRAALPRRVTPDILGEALGLEVTVEQLQKIVRENIFLSRVAGEISTFIFHPLFRDFLCKQLQEEAPASVIGAMHRRLAGYYAERENWGFALHHLFEAGDERAAAELMVGATQALLEGGLTETLGKYFPRLNRSTLEEFPQLYNLMGEMSVIEGDNAQAASMFEAGLAASRDGGALEATAALAGLAHTAARERNFKDALRYAEQASMRAPLHDGSRQSAALAARIKNVIGAVRVFEGDYTEASDLMEEALRLAHEASDARLVRAISHNLALPAYMEGDFHAALRYFARSPIADAAESTGRWLHPDSITLYLNRSSIYTVQGRLELAERDLENAAELAALFNLRGFMGRVIEGRANIARERRNFDEAARLYDEALDEYRAIESDPVNIDLYYERALSEMRRGELSRALDLINLMVEDRQHSGRDIEESLARQMRGRILLEQGDPRAIADADASEAVFRRLRCNYYLAISCYVRARALAGRDGESSRRALEEFLMLAEKFDYGYFAVSEEYFHPALVELCRLYGLKSRWLETTLQRTEERGVR